MEELFYYLERKFKVKYKLKFIYKNNDLIIKNNYYHFKLKRKSNIINLSYYWKYGLLNILFRNQYKNMLDLYKSIKNYSKKHSIKITEIHYNRN